VIALSLLDVLILETPLLQYVSVTLRDSFYSLSILSDGVIHRDIDLSSSIASTFFKVMFIFTNGPLPIAIPVWRNSIVFHDYDKITSVYIHILPAMLYYCARWYGHDCFHRFSLSYSIPFQTSDQAQICLSKHENFVIPTLYVMDYVYAALVYFMWQVMYYFLTEVFHKEKLDNDQKLQTSLQWLSSDTKNPTARSHDNAVFIDGLKLSTATDKIKYRRRNNQTRNKKTQIRYYICIQILLLERNEI
jgi:hypothetical protein